MRTYLKKRVFLKDFGTLPNTDSSAYSLKNGSCTMCYNMASKNGALTKNFGIEHMSMPLSKTNPFQIERAEHSVEIVKVWRYKYYSAQNGQHMYLLVCYGSDGKLYFNNMFFADTTYHVLSNSITFDQTPSALLFRNNGIDTMAFCSQADDMLIWPGDDDDYVLSSAPHLKSLCLHNNRLYAIDAKGEVVKYSSLTNLLEWNSSSTLTGAGEIELNDFREDLVKVVSFKENLYVFSEHGISKIQSFFSGTQHTSSNIFSTSAKIFAGSICVCASRIYFLTSDGLYFFNGIDAYKVDLKIDSLLKGVEQSDANACYYEGSYYLACKLAFDDLSNSEQSFANNSLLKIDVSSHDCSIIRGVDVSNMLAINDLIINKLVLCVRGSKFLWQLSKTGSINGTALSKFWQSGKFTLDKFDTDKILKSVYVNSSGNITLKISSDKMSKTFALSSPKTKRQNCNIVGKEFSVAISSQDNDFKVENIELVFSEEA